MVSEEISAHCSVRLRSCDEPSLPNQPAKKKKKPFQASEPWPLFFSSAYFPALAFGLLCGSFGSPLQSFISCHTSKLSRAVVDGVETKFTGGDGKGQPWGRVEGGEL